jgi:hypothetical protein
MTLPSIPEDPRLGRQRVLATYLRVCLAIASALALVAAVVPDDWTDRFGRATVAVLVLAPVGRVLWLLVRWTRRGDRRFAVAAVALLGVMSLALVLA